MLQSGNFTAENLNVNMFVATTCKLQRYVGRWRQLCYFKVRCLKNFNKNSKDPRQTQWTTLQRMIKWRQQHASLARACVCWYCYAEALGALVLCVQKCWVSALGGKTTDFFFLLTSMWEAKTQKGVQHLTRECVVSIIQCIGSCLFRMSSEGFSGWQVQISIVKTSS
jgi:hypothetical protein